MTTRPWIQPPSSIFPETREVECEKTRARQPCGAPSSSAVVVVPQTLAGVLTSKPYELPPAFAKATARFAEALRA